MFMCMYVFACSFACVHVCIRAFRCVECVFSETGHKYIYMYLVYLLTYPNDMIIECQPVRVEKTLYLYDYII